jgi:hypothetical protein
MRQSLSFDPGTPSMAPGSISGGIYFINSLLSRIQPKLPQPPEIQFPHKKNDLLKPKHIFS